MQKANSFRAINFQRCKVNIPLSFMPIFLGFIEKGEENGLYATLATGFFLETAVPNPAKPISLSFGFIGFFGNINSYFNVFQV